MLLLVLHVIVLVVLIVMNMLACVPTTLRPIMSTKLLEFCYKSEIWASLDMNSIDSINKGFLYNAYIYES